MTPRARARAQSLATVLVLESIGAALTILFNCEHRFAEHEHEHEEFRTVPLSRTLI